VCDSITGHFSVMAVFHDGKIVNPSFGMAKLPFSRNGGALGRDTSGATRDALL
jgi:hypothetical protein